MSERIYPWGSARRYNSSSDYFKRVFGGRVQKVSVNAGFTCPNRDGSTGTEGCTYCNNLAFSPSYCLDDKPVSRQVEEGIMFHKKRYRRADKYIAYFQSYTNTYAGAGQLRKIYSEALAVPGVIGLVAGTRPDCIDDEILDLFAELSENYYTAIEYGIESCYDRTLAAINRGHDFAASVEAINKTAAKGIRTGGHIIFGLPGETREEMLDEAGILSGLPLNNLKFHQLQIVSGTAMEEQYRKSPGEFELFGLEEYLEFMAGFIELLSPLIVIERFAGEVPPRYLAGGERWGLRNESVVARFDKKLEERDSWQGKRYGSDDTRLRDQGRQA